MLILQIKNHLLLGMKEKKNLNVAIIQQKSIDFIEIFKIP